MLVVDHTGKEMERGARGSNALRGAADTEFFAKPGKDADTFVLKNTKQKDRAKLPDLTLHRVVIGPSCALIRDAAADAKGAEATPGKAEKIDIAYAALRLYGSDGATFGKWFAQCGGMSKSTFNRVRQKLLDTGRVLKEGDGDDSVIFLRCPLRDGPWASPNRADGTHGSLNGRGWCRAGPSAGATVPPPMGRGGTGWWHQGGNRSTRWLESGTRGKCTSQISGLPHGPSARHQQWHRVRSPAAGASGTTRAKRASRPRPSAERASCPEVFSP
jgi:hypothetical protein